MKKQNRKHRREDLILLVLNAIIGISLGCVFFELLSNNFSIEWIIFEAVGFCIGMFCARIFEGGRNAK